MRRTERGVTLLELIIVIAVLAIVTTTMVPGLQKLFENTARRTQMQNMVGLFHLARTEAVSQGTIVTICPLDGSDRCTGDWQKPVHVFVDPENQRALSSGQAVLRVQEPPDSGSWTVSVGNRGYFQYRPNGMIRGTLGNLTWCPESADEKNAGQLIINMGGRLRYARDHSGDGVVQGSNGKPVHCP
ncbi:GspH/FimT family pseudopilin [Vreelandella utahensis]|uniref:GspH/FimT family pseudopilin n=1 Tax=Vreelandella halophila TaxID=86177 RepID=UPI000986A6A0|nr:GspH/FimT family pseudopilin [Halomonas utahensis]